MMRWSNAGAWATLKLDSACYLYAAWHALAEMANVLDRPEAEQYRARAAGWRERFERDWWIEARHLYADSLHSDLCPQLDGHWTQVVPIQLGIAGPERAQLVLDELERSFVNEYGLVHTRGREDFGLDTPHRPARAGTVTLGTPGSGPGEASTTSR